MSHSRGVIAVIVLALLAALLAAACAPAPVVPTVLVITQVVAPMTPEPTPSCTPLLPGMAFTLTTQPNALMFELTGLQPSEHPTIILWQQAGGRMSSYTTTSYQPAGQDGHLVYKAFGLHYIGDSGPNVWHIQVVHAKGVACTQVTLP
jgi:hypothetical protein